MHDLLDAVRAVDGGGFIQFRVDIGHRAQINDGVVSHALPQRRRNIQRAEPFRLGKKGDALIDNAQMEQRLVKNARAGKQALHHAHHDHRGKKIGHVGNRLHHALEAGIAQFIENQRQQDGRGERPQNVIRAQQKRVANQPPAIWIAEKALKMLEAHHRRAKIAPEGVVILKRRDQTIHGKILEHDQKRQPRKNHHV